MGLELPTDSGSGSETESNSLECHQRITGTVFQKKYLERMAEKKLEHIWHPLLRETAELVRKTGKAGYQENILKELSEKLVGCDQNQNL